MEALSEQQAVCDGLGLYRQRPAGGCDETCAWWPVKTVGPPDSGKLNVRGEGKGRAPGTGLGRWGPDRGKRAAADRPCLRLLNHSFPLDLVVLHRDRSVIEHCRHRTQAGLKGSGLELSEPKTRIAYTLEEAGGAA